MSEHKKKKNPAATMMMTSLAYIVLGIVTVVFPQKVLDVLCYALGGAMTVYGLFNIISFFVDREGGMYFELVIGVISTGFGIFALFSPTSIAAIINIPIGIIIIVDSIMDMKHSAHAEIARYEKMVDSVYYSNCNDYVQSYNNFLYKHFWCIAYDCTRNCAYL